MISRSTCPRPNTLPRTARNQKPHHVPVEGRVCGQWGFVVHFAADERHGARVSREAFLHHGLHNFSQPWQSILVRVQRHCLRHCECGSSPQMVKRRDTHGHVNPCVHDEALFVWSKWNALDIPCGSKSSWLFDGPWALLFFAVRTVWGSVRQTRSEYHLLDSVCSGQKKPPSRLWTRNGANTT